MDKTYNPNLVEEKIYKLWEESGYFNPDVCVEKGIAKPDAEVFSMVLPPPNVTGRLHIGHAFEDAIQDIAARFARMRGKRTLWIPGTDHAAIATQAKVEKDIMKNEKKNRHDLGREEFLRRVNAFAKASHDTIVRQIKRLGASLDWSREAYTLDDKRNLAVRTAFKKMYDLGLIYRANRIVNWDPKGQTTISDDEVVREERKAKFYTFRYAKDFPIAISTTRPETKVGDTAVAVHPDDPRYKKFVGQEHNVSFCGVPLHIKIVADPSVDKDFGTGALGVTPAHSAIDWEIAERHELPLMQVIDEHARMTVAGPLHGKKAEEAREWIVEELRRSGLMEKEEEIIQNVATAERTGGIIEPLPKLQWFVKVNAKFKIQKSKLKGIKDGQEITLKEIMRDVVLSGQIKILPEHFEKIYFHWIDNLRDWCISRQIWFGHRIPVWYCMGCGEPHVDLKIKAKWLLVRHGETDWNKENRVQGHSDIPLNETGKIQARQVAETLKNEKVDLVISSDLIRAKQTAEIINEVTKSEIIIDKNLRELHSGDTEGMTIQKRNEIYGDLYRAYEKKPPGGESIKDLEERIWPTFGNHKRDHRHKNIVIVTHGGVIRSLVRKIKNFSFEEMSGYLTENTGVLGIEIGDSCKKCGGDMYEQDSDTLDTWFSSGMWTFSTLGWPLASARDTLLAAGRDMPGPENDFANYHPNTLMAPGYEILFFWVARMILMSGCLLGDIPFRKVALHGIVRDAKGKKFSKSLDNGIDPLELADKYGADAVRMALIVGTALGNDVKFDEKRVVGYRNFSTKIWNVARFIAMNRPDIRYKASDITERSEYLRELENLKSEITAHIENFEFHLAGEKLYHYIWHTLADKIIEAEKNNLKTGDAKQKLESYALLEHLLLESLKMLHPFMPFVTEEIWQKFHQSPDDAAANEPKKMLMVEKW